MGSTTDPESTRSPNAAASSSTTVYSLSDTDLAPRETTGSSKTAGAQCGETRATSCWPGTTRTCAASPPRAATPSSRSNQPVVQVRELLRQMMLGGFVVWNDGWKIS